jgi:hypothetical protein
MQIIQRAELSSAASEILFSSIPDTFTDLVLVISARITANDSSWWMRFNGTSTGYSERLLYGNGSSAASASAGTSGFNLFFINGSGTTSNTFNSTSVYIPNYTASQSKSVSLDMVTENNATNANQGISAGLWSNNAAISSIRLFYTGSSNDIATGSSATLYGILKGSSGGVTVS